MSAYRTARYATGEKCQNGAEAALLSGISFAVPLIVAGGTVLRSRYYCRKSSGYKICLMKKTLVVDVPQAGRRDARDFDGIVLAAYTAYSLADKPALAPGFRQGLPPT